MGAHFDVVAEVIALGAEAFVAAHPGFYLLPPLVVSRKRAMQATVRLRPMNAIENSAERTHDAPLSVPLTSPMSLVTAQVHVLPHLARVHIGRGPDNELVLDDVTLSRRHAAIDLALDRGCFIEDLGSRNGTYLRGARIEAGKKIEIATGDALKLGSVELIFADAEECARIVLDQAG